MKFFTLENPTAGVEVATFSNPPMGYFTSAALLELTALVPTWEAPAIRAVVICGEAGVFIPHFDLDALLVLAKDKERLKAEAPKIYAGFHQLADALERLPKPVIFGLTGDAMGGGLELALAGDIRIAQAGDYRIGPIEARIGAVPGGGGTQRLVRMLGRAAALEILLRGLILTPEEAKSRGLVHEVAADARVRAVAIATDLAALPHEALAQTKRAVYMGSDIPFSDGLRVEGESSLAALLQEETVQRIAEYVALSYEQRRAFLEPKG